ncbi:nucleoside hydrolase [Bacillus sp. 31A1R]|uniref:Nucleoside hydrolase n=1 Tax=Robertmurraya mangrovi TaxID=3098077 RepID=A0ABU5J193_9BACI|nr:nucleoside hydrolase [Bacillus sp. 31A1R]MDZ5473122.1 nucleoside hydrolase [Bacillus sp. 31A1R]
MKKYVLLFSDFGIDDMVAIIYALFDEEIEIIGVVADYGNVSKEDAVRNAAYLQQLTGITDIPVFGGADLPLTGESPEYFPEVHGLEGLGPIIPEDIPLPSFENFYEINTLIEKYKNQVIIVNVGRLSSLATAFILYPELMKSVKEFYIMGGAFQSPGNITPIAEANFYGDPYAANIIINKSPKPVFIIPLDVTSGAIITPEMVNQLDQHYQKTQSKIGLLVKPMVDYYYEFYKKRDPQISGSPLHDLLTLWAVSSKSIIQYEEVPVKVVVNTGPSFGQSIGDFRRTVEKEDYQRHNVARNFDYQQFIKNFFETMKNSSGETS